MIGRFLTAVIVIVVLYPLQANAACTLSNPYWPSGGKKLGERVELSVKANGCSSDLKVRFEIYHNDSGGVDAKIRDLEVPIKATTTANTVITTADWQGPGESSDPFNIYFIAQACIAGVCTNEVRANDVTIELEGNPTPTPTTPTPTTPGGNPTSYTLNLENPLNGPSDIFGLVNAIARWIFNLAIPIGVIFIIWGGIQFLIAGGNPSAAQKGKDTLKYAIIGLAIVFIGYGFVNLVKSIIELGGDPETTQTP